MALSFELLATDGAARRGRLITPHGTVETPAFMPVGTLGAVKGITPSELAEAGAEVMLANLYHLAVRPGIDVVESLGGLHRFTGWKRPILTDSGGFQTWSLARLAEVDDDGVTFRNHLDGGRLRFTPERVVEHQRRLGVDVAMVLDECPPWPIDRKAAAASLERTLVWAEKSRRAWPSDAPGGLFGIAQGSAYRELRERAADRLATLDFDGYAIGGVSVGEPMEERRVAVEWTAPRLPGDRPRYLMGVGTPDDILHAIRQGVDLFDCVLPTRNARHGLLYTREGPLQIKNARFRDDPGPVDADCSCPTCRQVSRAFLHHLTRARELGAKVLATLHNVRYYLDFMDRAREAIASGGLSDLAPAGDQRRPPATPSPESDTPRPDPAREPAS